MRKRLKPRVKFKKRCPRHAVTFLPDELDELARYAVKNSMSLSLAIRTLAMRSLHEVR